MLCEADKGSVLFTDRARVPKVPEPVGCVGDRGSSDPQKERGQSSVWYASRLGLCSTSLLFSKVDVMLPWTICKRVHSSNFAASLSHSPPKRPLMRTD